MVLVWEGDTVVGASSGLPLAAKTPNVIHPFVEQGYDPERIFYYGESVLLPSYRGRGLGARFFEEREAHVHALGRFDILCFCAVERPLDHPRRLPNYVPLDRLWQKRGFVKHPELHTTFSWQDLDENQESPKPMTFWLKCL
jgi:GNAT superfamily N-acetyltransferase